jgi:hypothetical protein
VSGQLHVPVALLPGKESTVPTGWTPQQVRMSDENSWPYRDSNSDPSIIQSVASRYVVKSYINLNLAWRLVAALIIRWLSASANAVYTGSKPRFTQTSVDNVRPKGSHVGNCLEHHLLLAARSSKFFGLDYGDSTFLRNVAERLQDYMELHPSSDRRWQTQKVELWNVSYWKSKIRPQRKKGEKMRTDKNKNKK